MRSEMKREKPLNTRIIGHLAYSDDWDGPLNRENLLIRLGNLNIKVNPSVTPDALENLRHRTLHVLNMLDALNDKVPIENRKE